MAYHALVVDDNELNVLALKLLLQQEGVSVLTANSPQEMSQRIDEAEQLDVIFLDLELPRASGLELVQTLRADARLANVPITAYTVHTSEQNEARAAGFDSFLGKPLNVHRFPNQLQRILRGERVWDTGA